MIVLAGDIGGTNARLALYAAERSAGERHGSTRSSSSTYPSTGHPSLDEIAEHFLAEARRRAHRQGAAASTRACLGIAGPVENNICRATNLPWVVDGRALARAPRHRARHAGQRLQRRGAGRDRRRPDAPGRAWAARRRVAQRTDRRARAPAPASARRSCSGRRRRARYQVIPSEGGHADLAPRTPLEAGAAAVPDRQVRPRLVRAGAVRPAGWSTSSRSCRRSRRCAAADPRRHARRAGGARPRARPGGGDHPQRGLDGLRPDLRDGAGDLLLGAGRAGGQPGPVRRWPRAACSSPAASRRASCRTCRAAASARRSSARAACTRWSRACPPSS